MAKKKYVKESGLVKAINTDGLQLEKPLINEFYDINVHNRNMDKIDIANTKNVNDINNIKDELVESENTKYQTVNGVKEFESKSGYVDNIKIEGVTLVNLARRVEYAANEEKTAHVVFFDINSSLGYNIISDGEFTICNLSDKDLVFECDNFSTNDNYGQIVLRPFEKKVVNIPRGRRIYSYFGNTVDFPTMDDFKSNAKAVILKGNQQGHINFFEGLKSVGQGDKIEVLTCKTDGDLLPKNLTFTEGRYVNSMTGEICISNDFKYSNEYIPIKENDEYMLWNINRQFAIYDSNKKLIPHNWLNINPFKGDGYQGIFPYTMPKGASFIRINLPVSNLKHFAMYEGKYDKKQILSTLRSLPNGVRDEIYQVGNKYYKLKKCEEFVIDGNADFKSYYYPPDNTLRVQIDISKYKVGQGEYTEFLSDRIKYEIDYDNITPNHGFISDSGKKLWVFFDKTIVSEDNIISYLNNNPIRFVSALTKPILEEIPNFNPVTFEGQNTLLINSGVVQAEAEFEATNNLRNEIDVLKGKVSSLDDGYIYKFSPTLLNGYTLENDVYSNCYRKGNFVNINITLSIGVKNIYTKILKLDNSINPSKVIGCCLFHIGSNTFTFANLKQDGYLELQSPINTSSNNLSLSISYFI